ncbi:radical SAM-modified peptide, FtsH ternary system-associated [Catellatospora coxensis]|uniref:Uncharacterized protein n=1 Tax=Catellatospora coxensis TaxID=310354 RepID=A0A8J3PBI0_9ACTN|nr:radical SAM-modified peptide, FtsH ternary system-associated [Catellatospora coxensis]GIG10922.1 hypothetical protein Cco03nite_76220 [Catellatospora coxensis]
MAEPRYVQHLPDLIMPEEYADHPDGRLVRLRISVCPDGVDIVGDAFRPEALERLLAAISEGPIDQMLCG